LKVNHNYFVNGGVYYNSKQDYKRASEFFEKYWEIPSYSLFDEMKPEEKIITNDSTFQIIKYYAIITAIQAEDHQKTIKLLQKAMGEPFIENSVYKESDLYEFLTDEYRQVGDTVKYIQALEQGAKKYPSSKFFIPYLINELITKKEMEKALQYLDIAIANDDSEVGPCEFISVKASIFAERTEYDKAIEIYNQALSTDPNCEKALEGLAVIYIVEGRDLRNAAAQNTVRKEQVEMDEQADNIFKKAIPLLEKYITSLKNRGADPALQRQALAKLSNVYYVLRMDDEMKKVDKEMETLPQ